MNLTPSTEDQMRIEDRIAVLSAHDRQAVVWFVDRLLFADPEALVVDAWGNPVEQTPEVRQQILDVDADTVIIRRSSL
jgi:hypothetical protein